MLLDRFLEGTRKHVVEGWIIHASDGLRAHEMMQLPGQAVELAAHLALLQRLGFVLHFLMVARQVLFGSLAICFDLLKIRLSAIVIMKVLSAPPSPEELLDDGGAMMKEMSVQALGPLEPLQPSPHTCQPSPRHSLHKEGIKQNCMPSLPNLGSAVDTLHLDNGFFLNALSIASGLSHVEVNLPDSIKLLPKSEEMRHGTPSLCEHSASAPAL